jgi:hypothetical protein
LSTLKNELNSNQKLDSEISHNNKSKRSKSITKRNKNKKKMSVIKINNQKNKIQLTKILEERQGHMEIESIGQKNEQKEKKNQIQEQKLNNNLKNKQKKNSKVIFIDDFNLKMNNFINSNSLPHIPKSEIYIIIDNIFSDEELNAMNFLHSLKYDKRNIYQIYLSLINCQIPLFFLFYYYNSNPHNSIFQIKYPSAKLIFFCIEIYVCFFFNATVFGTKSVGYQFYGTYTFWKHLAFACVLFPFCLTVNSFFHFLFFNMIKRKIIEIKLWCFTKFIINKKSKINNGFDYFIKKEYVSKYHRTITKLENIHPSNIERKVKHHKEELKKLILKFMNTYGKKINTLIIFTCIGIIIMWYYITALCVAFKNSQGNFLLNVLLTFILCNLFPSCYCFIPAYIRHKSLKEENKALFNISIILRAL